MQLYNGEIRRIHFEPTSQCNARCPLCARTYWFAPEKHPNLAIDYWKVEEVEQVMADPLFSKVRAVLINGSFGDIVAHPDPKGIINAFLKHHCFVAINTNGGAQSKEFWHWLGQQKNVYVNFGIDGLSDTHHLYRRRTRFENVINNAKTFIDAGGEAHWTMTIFKHNQHQEEEAKALASELGFYQFTSRPNTRWGEQKVSCVNKRYEHEYYIESLGSNESLGGLHYSREQYERGRGNFSDAFPLSNYHVQNLKPAKITCSTWKDASIYLSFDKRLFPCCWTATGFELEKMKIESSTFNLIYKKWEEKDPDYNNIIKRTPSEVWEMLNGFSDMVKTWSTEKPCSSCHFACVDGSEVDHEKRNTEQKKLKKSSLNLVEMKNNFVGFLKKSFSHQD